MSGSFWATLVIQAFVAIYVYGRLTERVNSHGKRLDKAEDKLDDHETRIGHLEGARRHG